MARPGSTFPPGRRSFAVQARYAYELDRPGFLTTLRERHGDVFHLDRRRVVVCDPELAHEVLARTGDAFLAGHDALHGFVLEDPKLVAAWMRGRRAGWAGVGPAMLAAHARRLDIALTRDLAELSRTDFDVVEGAQTLMARAAIDFCVSRGNEDLADAAGVASLAQLAVQNTVIPALSRLPHQAVRRGREADRRMRAAIDACVTGRDADPAPEPVDLLDVLRASGEFTDEHVARILKRTLVGSHGVPGTALSWVIREVATRPEVVASVRAEAGALSTAVDAGSTAPLRYTEATVKEVLRLFPPVWLMLREVAEPTVLGRWRLEPRQHVLLPVYLLHRDPRWWAEPERFHPERWLGAGKADEPHARHAYLPFGGGPRICVGARLGLFQLVLATQRLVGAYDVELLGVGKAEPVFAATLAPAGLRARLVPRAA